MGDWKAYLCLTTTLLAYGMQSVRIQVNGGISSETAQKWRIEINFRRVLCR